VDASTVNSTNIVITGPGNAVIPAKMSFDAATAVATLTPSGPLPSGTISVTVQNVADAGVAMTAKFTWSFNTSCPTAAPAAYVYVTNRTQAPYGTPSQITAYAADANGQLTPVPGSPFPENVGSLAANSKYLIASANSQPDINTYAIQSDGSLSLAEQFDYTTEFGYQSNSSATCGAFGGLLFDPSGQSMYGEVDNIQCSSNNAVASFSVDSSTGGVSYLGNVNIGYEASGAISFLGNDAYAYSALFDACMYGGISSFARGSDGNLTDFQTVSDPPFIPAPPGATGSIVQPDYRPGMTAGDNASHVAMAEFPCYMLNGIPATQVQLATYTADGSGHLTTNDTYATMPAAPAIQSVFGQMKISPSGTLLAVGGDGGLQVFHFNGANPITTYTGLLTTDHIKSVAWDNNGHLYAITNDSLEPSSPPANANKLYVFTVTDTSATPAPGSPYTIAFPEFIAVQGSEN